MHTRTFAAGAPAESVAVAVIRKSLLLARMIVPGFNTIEIRPTDADVEISTPLDV
jgi:hypothetical protein